MTINWEQIIITVIITVPGTWALMKQLKKERIEAEKTKEETKKMAGADTTKTYAEAAEKIGQTNIKLYERIEKLEQRVDDLFRVNCEKDQQISILRDTLEQKDDRISDLELLSKKQGIRIAELEKEVEYINSQKGGS